MRSDFYSLPWAAQQAIRKGRRAADDAEYAAYTANRLRVRVDELEKALAEANATIAKLTATAGEGEVG